MELRSMLAIVLVLDAQIVLFVGLASVHGEHGWDFFLINGLRLAVEGAVLLLWRLSANTRVQEILFQRKPSRE